MGFGPSAALGVKMAQPGRAVVALIGDGGFSTNPSVIATAMEAELAVVWLVMDNAGFGTIAGLEAQHYGWSYGCMFERCGKPYRVDYAHGVGARARDDHRRRRTRSGDPRGLARGCRRHSGADGNAPTPTPGYWNINDIANRE
jgi:acetolactate synthase-1/2/3 large subunit